MKKRLGIIAGILGIVLAVIGIVLKQKENIAVSVIGGADGPTSIFIAGKLNGDNFIFMIVVGVLTDSVNPTDYLKKMRKRDEELATYLGTTCPQVEMVTDTGKKRKTLAANVQALFRIIQSIPSPKAEPFKLWLAQVGYERVQEIENPELAQERMKELYEQKGYPKDWIDKRLRGIAIRQNLTDEWKERGKASILVL